MNLSRTQRGITLSGMIVGSIVLGAIAVTGMKLWPVYNEKFKVDMAMDKLASLPEGSRMSKLSLAKELQKQFDVQDVDSLDEPTVRKLLQVENRKGSRNKFVTLQYEIRTPFFSNLDIVMNYDKTVELGAEATD